MSFDDRTEPPTVRAPTSASMRPGAGDGWAALQALEHELDRVFFPSSPARLRLVQPLAAVRTALDEVIADPEAEPGLAAALDTLEDVVESLLRAAGWPAGVAGREEPVRGS